MCGKKGHIRPDFPLKEDEKVDEQVEVDETPKPKSSLKKKAVQFVATTADDEEVIQARSAQPNSGFVQSTPPPRISDACSSSTISQPATYSATRLLSPNYGDQNHQSPCKATAEALQQT